MMASFLCAPSFAQSTFKSATRAVEQNMKSEAGKAYDQTFGEEFARQNASSMQRCTQDAAAEDLASFDILTRVSVNGRPENVLVEPKTTVARCVQRAVRRQRFPKPPAPHYWVRVHMSIRD
jgi:hypothetical protein